MYWISGKVPLGVLTSVLTNPAEFQSWALNWMKFFSFSSVRACVCMCETSLNFSQVRVSGQLVTFPRFPAPRPPAVRATACCRWSSPWALLYLVPHCGCFPAHPVLLLSVRRSAGSRPRSAGSVTVPAWWQPFHVELTFWFSSMFRVR